MSRGSNATDYETEIPTLTALPSEIGDASITLQNLNDLSITEQVFEVLINPARFDVNTSATLETDGRLDGMDYIWIRRFGGLQYDPDFDFDGDGLVDGIDLMYVANDFGHCWDGDSWKVSACP